MEQAASKPRTRKRVDVDRDSEYLSRQTARLLTIDDAGLRQRWAVLFGADPSPTLSRVLMLRSIAYRLQEKALGSLKPSAQRLLNRVCDGPLKVASKRPKMRAAAGTVLIREWHGVAHRVTVLDDDVVYRGRRYKSLSEVARLITGTHWSGPMFFRPYKPEEGGGQWLTPRSGVAQSTLESPRRKGWSTTSTPCTRSARRARRSSGARRARAGGSSAPPTTMEASPVEPWSGRRSSNSSPTSAGVSSTWWWSTRSTG